MKQTYNKLAILGMAFLSVTGGVFYSAEPAMVTTGSIHKMYADNSEIYNETAIFENEKSKGIVIEEKEAINPIYIFSEADEVKYASAAIPLQLEPHEQSEPYTMSEAGMELHIEGYNSSGYAKVTYENRELYVLAESLTEDAASVIKPCDYEKYFSDTSLVYDSASLENPYDTIDAGTKVDVIGENEAGISKIQFETGEGYVLTDILVNQLPREAYLEIGSDGVTEWYSDNMVSGVLAEIPDSEKTEDNAVKLAKLIHCEAGGQTEEGKLAVATVVINRVYDGRLGTTVEEVIQRDGQFSPVASGAYDNASFSQSDYDAATKVLFDGYRSFPAYVMYFQSHYDGYFNGHRTYVTCYDAGKNRPQYFSYKESDMHLYSYY